MDAIRIVLSSIKRADFDYNLINDGDRIALGVSGGKDSMLLLYSLILYKKYSKIDFSIVPINIDLGFKDYNNQELSSYVKSLGLDLVIADGRSVYEILSAQQILQKTPHLPCSICSKMKKAIINKEAKRQDCNKVAFAHHADDAIETLFLNEIYGGRISTFSPKMFLENEKVEFIRPFIYLHESEIKRAVKENNIPIFKSGCPNDGKTKREDIKNILLDLYKNYPSAKDNFLTMLSNQEKIDLFYTYKEKKINRTNLYYKEVFSSDSLFDEIEYFSKQDYPYLKNHKHFHLYQNNILVGVAIFKVENRNLIVSKIKVSKKEFLIPFLFDIYKNVYEKINPLTLMILDSKEYENELLKMGCIQNQESKIYELSENPRHLDALYIKQKLY